jgi:hypothetical protein
MVEAMNQRVFKATATREGKWWVVDVQGVGVTQGRSAEEARVMAAGLVEAVLEIDEPVVEVEFAVRAVPKDKIKKVRRLIEQANTAQQEAAKASRLVAAELHEAGLSGRDTAAVMGLSPQRVSQLLRSDTAIKPAPA